MRHVKCPLTKDVTICVVHVYSPHACSTVDSGDSRPASEESLIVT
jgi:hypothetical protein